MIETLPRSGEVNFNAHPLTETSSEETRTATPELLFSPEGYPSETLKRYADYSLGDALYYEPAAEWKKRLAAKEEDRRTYENTSHENLSFGINNIRKHMGVWAAPAEELRHYALDLQVEILRAQNKAQAVSDEDPDAPSKLTSSFVPVEERLDIIRADTSSLAAYDFMKLMRVENHLSRQTNTELPVSEEFGIDFTSLAKELGMDVGDFFNLCQTEQIKIGEQLFITPIKENEPYPDMLKRERLYLVHRIRQEILRLKKLPALLEQEYESAVIQHANNWKDLELAVNNPGGPNTGSVSRMRANVNYSLHWAAAYVKAQNQYELIIPFLYPDQVPVDQQAEVHQQRTNKEIELRVARFTEEHNQHVMLNKMGLNAVIGAERHAMTEEKRQVLDIVVGRFVRDILPGLSPEDASATLAWTRTLNIDKGTYSEAAVFFLESELQKKLGNVEQSKTMGRIAQSIHDTVTARENPRTHDGGIDSVTQLFMKAHDPVYRSIFSGQAAA